MPGSHDPHQNHLLVAMSPAERERLYPHPRMFRVGSSLSPALLPQNFSSWRHCVMARKGTGKS